MVICISSQTYPFSWQLIQIEIYRPQIKYKVPKTSKTSPSVRIKTIRALPNLWAAIATIKITYEVQ
jgi:hypothetical protein